MRYFRTVYNVEVLSTEPPADITTLEELAYETTEGHWSGKFEQVSCDEVPEERMAELLIAQGSDPEFLIPEGDDYDGND